MGIAMQTASTCDALSYPATRSSTLNEPEILSKQPGPPLIFAVSAGLEELLLVR